MFIRHWAHRKEVMSCHQVVYNYLQPYGWIDHYNLQLFTTIGADRSLKFTVTKCLDMEHEVFKDVKHF